MHLHLLPVPFTPGRGEALTSMLIEVELLRQQLGRGSGRFYPPTVANEGRDVIMRMALT